MDNTAPVTRVEKTTPRRVGRQGRRRLEQQESQTKATLKTRESLGGSGKRGHGCGNDSGDNEDFMPTKKAAGAKARKPIAPAGAASCPRPKAKAFDELDDNGQPSFLPFSSTVELYILYPINGFLWLKLVS